MHGIGSNIRHMVNVCAQHSACFAAATASPVHADLCDAVSLHT